MVTAYTDGAVTLRSNRRRDGYHEARNMSGHQGVEAGDLVVHGLDILRGSVGVSDARGAISSVCTVCSPKVESDARYVAYVVRAQAFSGLPRAMARGVREGGADFRRWDTLAELPIPLPLVSVQRRIADYLDRETARIDALTVAKRQMVQCLEERWRSVVETSMSTLIAEYGAIPLRHLVSCLDGRRVPVSSEERAGRRGPYPYYGASGIVDWIDDWLFDEELVLLGEDGAQLGDPSYPIAQLVRGKIWVNNHAHVLRPVAADPEFLSLHLNTFDRIAFMSGGTREKITQDDMNRIPFPRVSISHQREVARRLCRIRGKSDTIVSVLTRQTDLLQEHRQALITAAVIGQLDIPKAA